MLLSQRIAEMLEEMLEESGGELSIVRNELASRLGCVPSQINYVITSRFTPERGYVVESRRGGGGYVRIRKVMMHRNEFLMHFYQSIGTTINTESAAFYLSALREKGFISPHEERLVAATLSDSALAKVAREERGILRADLIKTVILQILTDLEG